jgi:hypothetical protein
MHVNFIYNFKKHCHTPLFVIRGFSGFGLNVELRNFKSLNWMYFAALDLDYSQRRSTVEVEEGKLKEEDYLGSWLILYL